MQVGFVTPRYGEQVVGGAEAATRVLAEHLVAELGWQAEVFTSCALDNITWRNELTAGTTLEHGVAVHRFPTAHERPPAFFEMDARVRVAPGAVTKRECLEWLELNGPVVPGLLDALEASGVDVAAFYPYLYHPAVHGIARVPMPAVLHPAAHDEPSLYLPIFQHTFRSADAVVFHTMSERRLVERAHRVGQRPQLLLGLGVGDPPPRRHPGGEVLGVGDRPYVVCLGRVDSHKGSETLAAAFRRYKVHAPGPLTLVFVGPVVADIVGDDDVVLTGAVSEQDKWDILRDAQVLVSPSTMESFSLVVMEAWAVGVPVVVHAACGPTREHCERSGGGLWVGRYRELEVALDRLLADGELRSTLGHRGMAYVDRHYRWPDLIRRYGAFLDAAVRRGRTLPLPL